MKVIRFETTFHNTLMGAGNYPEKIGFVEIPLPNNIDEKDSYILTKYVEQTTNLMAIGYLKVVEKESAESSGNEKTIPSCDCCKRNPATTAKGLCTTCDSYW